jgi:lipoate-protein ligase A
MFFVDNEGVTNPRVNLAIEEYIMRDIGGEEEVLLLYINEPAAIIGRNQNPLEEVNLEYTQAHNIDVVRRLSGGGAVYHDLGNLNFSFITQNRKEDFHNFQKFTEPAIRVLREIGVNAQLNNRNDIVVEGLKISGNAQYISRGRMLTHGTLLVHSDLDKMGEALRVNHHDISSRSIKSVRSRVANINDFLKAPLDMETLRLKLLEGIFEGVKAIPKYRLSEEDWARIKQISAERYQSWEWNFGRSPKFKVQKKHPYGGGEIKVQLEIENGRIQSIEFYGVPISGEEIARLEEALSGTRYEQEAVQAALTNVSEDRIGSPTGELLQSLGDWII